jgi:hypothetical protein
MLPSHCSEVQPSPTSTPILTKAYRSAAHAGAFIAVLFLAACATWSHDNIRDGIFDGVATVEWAGEDSFIYRPSKEHPLSFQPSFWKGTNKRIVPRLMYTDGGSVPRFFWNIPGLSPWGFGPAYVIHDYIFAVHRCGWYDPDVAEINFDKSAEVLAEVGKALIDLHYIKHDALDAIVWGVKTHYARTLWDTPGDPIKDCATPKSFAPSVTVATFDIRKVRRQLRMAPGER